MFIWLVFILRYRSVTSFSRYLWLDNEFLHGFGCLCMYPMISLAAVLHWNVWQLNQSGFSFGTHHIYHHCQWKESKVVYSWKTYNNSHEMSCKVHSDWFEKNNVRISKMKRKSWNFWIKENNKNLAKSQSFLISAHLNKIAISLMHIFWQGHIGLRWHPPGARDPP